ncbi:MAG TPA: tetratricopeptide repeat protein [Thermoanaerobaculia bacterium]|nr:tetratricopeptide repeat protein [Thermoanaerobaculia bacterium]HUM30565.1 tetratricopeptide repeat protein [Thermoanaerobaculia bacterium]HXK68757.1 tetratricopeptide repeat protein [Thermoanaerobaculia bacterium]
MNPNSGTVPFDHGVFLVHLNKGKEAMNNKDFELARLELELALRYRPEDEDVLNLLGLIYFRIKKYRQAEETYNRLLKKNPNIFILHSNLGLVLFKQGKVEDAEEHLRKATELNPNYAKAHLYLGLVYRRLGKYGMALEHFRFAGSESHAKEMQEKLQSHTKEESPEKPAPQPASPGAPAAPPPPVHETSPIFHDSDNPLDIPQEEKTSPFPVLKQDNHVIPVPEHTQPIQPIPERSEEPSDHPFSSVGEAFLRDTEEMPEKISLPTVKTVEHIGQKFVLHKNGFLEIHTPDKVFIKKGTLNSYVGNFRFHPLDTFHGTTAQPVVIAEGAGKLFLFEKGMQTYLIDLNSEFLLVEGSHLLALEHGLSVRQELTFPSPPKTQMDIFKVYGKGAIALLTHIEPLVLRVTPEYPLTINASSLVAWSGNMMINPVEDEEADVMQSGVEERHTLRFEGEGLIVAEQVD